MDRIQQLENFLKDSPNDSFLNHALALEYVKVENDEAAEACFQKNLNQDATYLATYYHLGKLVERTGNTEAAMKHYEAGMAVAKATGDNHTYNELQAAYEDLEY